MMGSIKPKIQSPIVFKILLQEIQTLPTFELQEIFDYALFIKNRHKGKNSELLLAAETSLEKDWLRPEEDEAWANL